MSVGGGQGRYTIVIVLLALIAIGLFANLFYLESDPEARASENKVQYGDECDCLEIMYV